MLPTLTLLATDSERSERAVLQSIMMLALANSALQASSRSVWRTLLANLAEQILSPTGHVQVAVHMLPATLETQTSLLPQQLTLHQP